MLASGSVFTATMFLAAIAPTQCWMAPEMPHARYTTGAIRVPVWPTWSRWLRQPLLVTAREQPTTPPSRPASSSSGANASADPTPRPPPTTTGAVDSVIPATRSTRSRDHRAGENGIELGDERDDVGSTGSVDGSIERHGIEGVVGRREESDRRVEGGLLQEGTAPPDPGQ